LNRASEAQLVFEPARKLVQSRLPKMVFSPQQIPQETSSEDL